jgi:hypothetical protein
MDISHAGEIIESAALLHNFIVDERLGETLDGLDVFDEEEYFRRFSHIIVQQLDEANVAGTNSTREDPAVAAATDNNEPPSGRMSDILTTNIKDGRGKTKKSYNHLS